MNHAPSACSTARPFISMEDVSLRLSEGIAFRHIHWEILGDQQWAVVGPNGSGKSTLMKALCGKVPVVEGRITYHFMEHGSTWQDGVPGALAQDQIALVSFDTQKRTLGGEIPFHQARWNSDGLQRTLTVSDCLTGRRIRQINPYLVVKEATDPALYDALQQKVVELLGIEELLERDILQISNGERRKVMLAQALLKSPQLLILDNPFAGLDRGYRSKLEQIIHGLMKAGMRFVLVANDLDEIPAGFTHVLLMGKTGIVGKGTKQAVLQCCASGEPVASDAGSGSALSVTPGLVGCDGQQTRVLVQMDGVRVSYNGVQVLNQIDWTVEQGEHWALLGPNGAGKTTLLSLILADNPQAYANHISLFGKRRGSGESIWDIKRQIGWVAPELHLFYPKGFSCFDVVCSGFFDSVGRYRHCTLQQRQTANWWMQSLGVGEMAGMMFDAISEGEQRMILLARALVKQPALLILDEPCQGLDASNRARVQQAVETISGRLDVAMIYVTHRFDALPRTITHVLELEAGRVVNRKRVNGVNAMAWAPNTRLDSKEERS